MGPGFWTNQTISPQYKPNTRRPGHAKFDANRSRELKRRLKNVGGKKWGQPINNLKRFSAILSMNDRGISDITSSKTTSGFLPSGCWGGLVASGAPPAPCVFRIITFLVQCGGMLSNIPSQMKHLLAKTAWDDPNLRYNILYDTTRVEFSPIFVIIE